MPGLDASATGNVLRALQMLTGQAGAKERAYGGAIQQAFGGLNAGMAKRDAWDQQDEQQKRAHEQARAMQARGFDFQSGMAADARHEREVQRGIQNMNRIQGNRAMFTGAGFDAPEGAGAMEGAAARALLGQMIGERQRGRDAAAVKSMLEPISGLRPKVQPVMVGSGIAPLMVPEKFERQPTLSESFQRAPADASGDALAAAARALTGDRTHGIQEKREERGALQDLWDRSFRAGRARAQDAQFERTEDRLDRSADSLIDYRKDRLVQLQAEIDRRLEVEDGTLTEQAKEHMKGLRARLDSLPKYPSDEAQEKWVKDEMDRIASELNRTLRGEKPWEQAPTGGGGAGNAGNAGGNLEDQYPPGMFTTPR